MMFSAMPDKRSSFSTIADILLNTTDGLSVLVSYHVQDYKLVQVVVVEWHCKITST